MGTGKEDGSILGLTSAGPRGRDGIPEWPSCKYPASMSTRSSYVLRHRNVEEPSGRCLYGRCLVGRKFLHSFFVFDYKCEIASCYPQCLEASWCVYNHLCILVIAKISSILCSPGSSPGVAAPIANIR